ncbi:integrase [Xanthomonas phaseoli pv. syngonii LMG 9055]|uniref:Integrase n=1 Tax=Xanthomonas phaseoli pv. syngonii LMG 9055 TaxID=1437878 RepID=A0A1V9GRD5_9XANT|nr:integrase [Xanthomonas phaseoli pv. syngonii LMG 9055]
MSSTVQQQLRDYITSPFGLLQIKGIHVGNVRATEINITGREAAIHALELFDRADERSRRVRLSKNRTHYPEPLPLGSPARLLSVEIADYLGHRDRCCLAKETIDATARTLKLLRIACGDIPVSRIDHAHIYKLWDLMRWAPPLLLSDPKYRDYTLEQAVALGKELGVAPPAPATLEKHRRFLVSFFGKLVKAKAIPMSPMDAFAEIKKDLVVDTDKPERLLDEEELQRIFSPTTFPAWAKKYPHRWWLPMISLYTGARINELAQLKVADIVEEAKVWCIRIQKTVDADLAHKEKGRSRQSLKGRAAIRTLPIPKPLLDAGFLDFLEDIKACGHPRLFPHLSAGVNRETGETNARYSQGAVNQFGAYMKTLGFGKGIGAHAFRHTLATELHHKNVSDQDIALITGHSLRKNVPVLHDAYFHKKPKLARAKQIKILAKYKPPVELPRYERGQFSECLADPTKFYP